MDATDAGDKTLLARDSCLLGTAASKFRHLNLLSRVFRPKRSSVESGESPGSA